MKKLLVIAALFFCHNSFCQNRQNLIETGTVISSDINTPVDGATIQIYPEKIFTISNELGKFSFLNRDHDPDSLFISAIGYEAKAINYKEFIRDNRIISLHHQPIELSRVTFKSNRTDHYDHIGKIDLQIRDVSNSQEVLRLVPGLFIGQHAGGGKAEQLFLRGFDLDHGTDINITVDGIPVNMVSHAHGQGYADLHFLIPELIDDISFRKGTYYAEKGDLTTAGYVEFKTKNILPNNLIKLEAGQFNTSRTIAELNLFKKETQSAFIAAEYMHSNGYFDNPQHFNRLNLFGKYNKKIDEKSDLAVSASTFYSKWNASGQIPERAVNSGIIGFFGAIDPNEGGNTARTNINAQLKTTLSPRNFLKNQVYYTNYNFELYSDFTFFLKDSVNGDQIRQKEKRGIFGYNGSFLHTGTGKFSIEAGISFRYDKTRNSELSRTKNRTAVTDSIKLGNIKEGNEGVWLNETFRWSKKFSINAGLRYDVFNASYLDKLEKNKLNKVNENILSPKLNLYYHLNNKTQIYFSTGKGFHSNDVRVVVNESERKILTAAYGADLGIIIKPAKNLLLQSALWWLKLDQEFVYVGDEGVVEPSGRSRRLGCDLSVRYQPVKWLYLDMDANYSRGKAIDEKKGCDYLPLSPVFTSIGGITYKNKMGLNAGLRYRYMGDRPANETNSVIAKGYFITDAIMNFSYGKFEIGVTIQNLFDARWKETQFYTKSRLKNESEPVSEIHFTPGTPLFFKGNITFSF